jgi:hypothetical protein
MIYSGLERPILRLEVSTLELYIHYAILHSGPLLLLAQSSCKSDSCMCLCLGAGSSPPSISPQQGQAQQQQQTVLPQQQQFRSISMTGALPTQQPQSLPAAADGPSLDHPSTIPLSVEGDVVRDAQGNVLLDRLHPNMSINAALRQYGALVLGASSERGATHAWDLAVGRVSPGGGGGVSPGVTAGVANMACCQL